MPGLGPIGTPPCQGLTPDPSALVLIDVSVFASSHGAPDAPLSPAAMAALIAVLGTAAFLRLRA